MGFGKRVQIAVRSFAISHETPPFPPPADARLGPEERTVHAAVRALRESALPGWDRVRRLAAIGLGYREARSAPGRPRVAVCGSELAHNAAGRVQILADLHAMHADVEIVGFLFPSFGTELWEPLRTRSTTPVHALPADREESLPNRIIDLVLEHPCDLVHLSKPRMPGILVGLACRAIWGAAVLVDVDDEELAFVKRETPAELEPLLADGGGGGLPPFQRFLGPEWTRFSVAMAAEFDGVTVVNEPLQRRYGGTIIRHARDFPSLETLAALRDAERQRLGIAADRVVVLFVGTPRAHKGLLETATMVARAACPEAVFLVVGDFVDLGLRTALEAVPGVEVRLLGNQPLERLPALTAAADLHVSVLDDRSAISRFQTPAKLTDALAGGLATVGRPSPGTADILEGIGGAFATLDEVAAELARLLRDPAARRERGRSARAWYERHLTTAANARTLDGLVRTVLASAPGSFRPGLAAGLDGLLGRALAVPGDGASEPQSEPASG